MTLIVNSNDIKLGVLDVEIEKVVEDPVSWLGPEICRELELRLYEVLTFTEGDDYDIKDPDVEPSYVGSPQMIFEEYKPTKVL